MAKKILYLGVIHMLQTQAPSLQQIINDPQYEEELKEQIKKLKNKSTLKKAIKKVAGAHAKKVKQEYVYLTDNYSSTSLKGATIIIDIDNKKLVKTRFPEAIESEVVELYMARYQDKIDEFNKRFRS